MAEIAKGKPAIPWSQTITLCLLVCFGWFCLVMSIILVIVHPYLGGMHRHPISKRGLNSPSIALYFDSDWQQAQKQIEMLAIWKHNVNSIHLCNIVYIYINIYIYITSWKHFYLFEGCHASALLPRSRPTCREIGRDQASAARWLWRRATWKKMLQGGAPQVTFDYVCFLNPINYRSIYQNIWWCLLIYIPRFAIYR